MVMTPAKSTVKTTKGKRKPGAETGRVLDAGAGWRRAFYMIGFALVAYWLLWLLFFLAVVQAVMTKINDEINPHLLGMTRNLNAYFAEMLSFLAFDSNRAPFPFSPFPNTDG